MASMELISLPTIVEQIRQLCTQLRTGTVFLVSDQNRMVQVHLDRGEIAFLMHRNRRGQEALQVIAGMRQARLRFDEADATRTEKDNLSTRDVLEYLNVVAQDAPAPDQAAATAVAGRAMPKANVVTSEHRAIIQAILVKYIGPMAEIVCAEHFAQATGLPSLVMALAGEIPVADHASRFGAEAAAALNLEGGGSGSR